MVDNQNEVIVSLNPEFARSGQAVGGGNCTPGSQFKAGFMDGLRATRDRKQWNATELNAYTLGVEDEKEFRALYIHSADFSPTHDAIVMAFIDDHELETPSVYAAYLQFNEVPLPNWASSKTLPHGSCGRSRGGSHCWHFLLKDRS